MEDIFGGGSVDPTLFGEGQGEEPAANESSPEQGQEEIKEPEQQQETPPQESGQGEEEKPDPYNLLRKDYTKKAMELAETKRQLAELQQQLQSKSSPQKESGQENDYSDVDPWVADNILKPMREMQQQLQQMSQTSQTLQSDMQFEKEVNDVVAKHPDFSEYVDEVGQVLEQNPALKNVPNKLEIAYTMAKAQKLEEVAKQAFENGKREGYKSKNTNQILEKGEKISQSTNNEDDDIFNAILNSGGNRGIFG
jgi:hypothetical protein